MSVRVLLVDDHAVVREGYRRLLERTPDIEVVAEASGGEDAYRLFCETAPDVVIMDITLPGMSGVEATRRIIAREPAARVLVFSVHEDIVFASRALQAGARGYIHKSSGAGPLVEGARAGRAGGATSPSRARRIFSWRRCGRWRRVARTSATMWRGSLRPSAARGRDCRSSDSHRANSRCSACSPRGSRSPTSRASSRLARRRSRTINRS